MKTAGAGSIAKSETANLFRIILEVSKIRITVFVALTTTLGYLLALNSLESFSLYPVLGIFMLSCGAAAMNHYQERLTDAMMVRTMNRPIPAGTISPVNVLMISFFFLLTGSMVLILKSNLLTLGIGLYTFLWYNAVYTPLKRISPFAIIPGSLVGALPPLAGWAAAGGDITEGRILLIASFFFVWQIPHFWLLLMIYGKDYDKGGFPNLTNMFSLRQLKRITFSWILLTAAIALSVNLSGIMNYYVSGIFMIIVCAWFVIQTFIFLKSETSDKKAKNMFISINMFSLLLITILSLDKLIKLFLS